MEKIYDPKSIEAKWRHLWEEINCFTTYFQHNQDCSGDFVLSDNIESIKKSKPTNQQNFCIMLPPPNVTGNLHMGHAFQHTIMDLLIRFRKMQGNNTLWQPGLDHAGISAQMVVERQLEARGIKRTDLPREEFVNKVWEWKEQYGSIIVEQMKRVGTAIDWSIARFTLDPDFSYAVKKVFIDLYNEGLIYKGKKLINWDPILQTAISDLEVVTEEFPGNLWYIKYLLADLNLTDHHDNNYLTIATTRPETLLGDVAIAVNPNDNRYKNLIGKQAIIPLLNKQIPIIGDDYVDPNFGTGCLKITPAHDHNDYAIAIKHNLPLINIFTKNITLNDNVPLEYRGLDKLSARERVLQDLASQSLLIKVEDCVINIPKSTSTNSIVEPFLTDQWFMKMETLAKPAVDAVESGKIKIIPQEWTGNYLEWLNNIQDWCISRQLWWGHQIPAWYDNQNNIYVGYSETEIREKHNLSANVSLIQETDVLDTWFSAALWPFATLDWPKDRNHLAQFFPTNVLVTGFDIIFFWVARMVMLSLKFIGKVPFGTVYVHGIIQDQEGQKMSKTKGNVIDPIDLIDGITLPDLIKKRTSGLMQPHLRSAIENNTKKQFPKGINCFGTDALRFTFCSIATQSRHIKFDFIRLESCRNFCNKLWNAARFVFINLADSKIDLKSLPKNLIETNNQQCVTEKWILSIWQKAKQETIDHINNFRFDLASKALYEFVWNEYCDWYLEFAKYSVNQNSTFQSLTNQSLTKQVLIYILDELLKVLHPFMPYITEEIWQILKNHINSAATTSNSVDDVLIKQQYPNYNEAFVDLYAEQSVGWIKKFITAVRNIRSSLNIAPGIKLSKVFVDAALNDLEKNYLTNHQQLIKDITKVEEIVVTDDLETKKLSIVGMISTNATEIWVPLAGLFDPKVQLERINKELNKLNKQLEIINNKLNNQDYLNNAPLEIVSKERNKKAELEEAINKLNDNLNNLGQI